MSFKVSGTVVAPSWPLKTRHILGCFSVLILAGCGTGTSVTPPSGGTPATQHILFVGDSYTHGRYQPVRLYRNTPGTGGVGSTTASPLVVDENFDTTVAARAESASEYGPWGGIPGIFAELASEAGLPYDVHIEAISATTLTNNYQAAQSVIDQSIWNSVVLQEATFEPISSALSFDTKSNPQEFCNAVATIEQGVHAASPNASVFLYATGAPADTGWIDATENGTRAFSASTYLSDLNILTSAYHDAYLTAAIQDGHIAGVAPVGDAWALAWSQGLANPNPYEPNGIGPYLTFDYQAGSQPATTNTPTDAGFHHPSIYGAYLSGLVLFQKITGHDVRDFGPAEKAAAALGISASMSMQLQQVAWQAVTQQNNQLVAPSVNACSATH